MPKDTTGKKTARVRTLGLAAKTEAGKAKAKTGKAKAKTGKAKAAKAKTTEAKHPAEPFSEKDMAKLEEVRKILTAWKPTTKAMHKICGSEAADAMVQSIIRRVNATYALCTFYAFEDAFTAWESEVIVEMRKPDFTVAYLQSALGDLVFFVEKLVPVTANKLAGRIHDVAMLRVSEYIDVWSVGSPNVVGHPSCDAPFAADVALWRAIEDDYHKLQACIIGINTNLMLRIARNTFSAFQARPMHWFGVMTKEGHLRPDEVHEAAKSCVVQTVREAVENMTSLELLSGLLGVALRHLAP